jgi:hypothetical protein
MTEPMYASRAVLEQVSSSHRSARIATGVTMDMGVHGPIRDFFQLQPERDLPLPVDYIVAATGG